MALVKSFVQDDGVDVTYWNIEKINFNMGESVAVRLIGYLSEDAKKVDGYDFSLRLEILFPWSMAIDNKDTTLQDLYATIYNEIKSLPGWEGAADALD